MSTFNPKRNLRTFDNKKKIDFNEDINFNIENVTMEDVNVSSKSLYILKNVLTKNECDQLIENSNPHYQSLDQEFLKSERQNNRVISLNSDFATIIYNRIRNFVFDDPKIKSVIPCGFGTDGIWEPYKINDCFRFNQYIGPSIGFTAHRDATYIENEDIRSILTILIYLNEDFDHGETIFLKSHNKRQKGQIVSEELANGYHERFKYKPVTGSALIFNHNMIHLGNKIFENDTKYVIRTDIVFKRIRRPEDYNYRWRIDPDFILAVKYYREAINQELDGNLDKASILFEKGLALRQFNRRNIKC